jgi:hypothetical protein
MATLGNFTAATLTAAELNAIGTWSAWTPTLTNLTLGSGATSTHRYSEINKVVVFRSKIVLGTGGSIGGAFSMTLPVNAYATASVTASVNLLNSGGSVFLGAVSNNGVGAIEVQALSASGTYASMTPVTTGVPFGWDVNDIITINGVYEAA